jgi:thioredoxin-related protein
MRNIGVFILLVLAFAACKAKKPTAVASNAKPVFTTPDTPAVMLPTAKISKTEVDAIPPKPAPAKTITWLDFESGYKKAIAENKILLVDMYTDWCYWCKVMDRQTYVDSAVIANLNTDFVTVKMNPEKDHTFTFGDTSMSNSELYLWLGYGKRNGFPTTYFWLTPNKSEERYCLAGYHEPAAFITILNQVKAKKQH